MKNIPVKCECHPPKAGHTIAEGVKLGCPSCKSNSKYHESMMHGKLTNNGEPHVCFKLQVYKAPANQVLTLCSNCMLPVDA